MQTNTQRRTDAVVDPIIEVEHLAVTFDMDRGVSRVVDDVSIDIERNEILGIVGESGSGKSMFGSALLNAVESPGQASGSVRYHPRDQESVDVLDLDERRLRSYRWNEISMVFQGAMSSFNPSLKIGGHFEETLDAHEEDEEEGMERARRLLSELYLDPDRVLEAYPHELSGGMKQRALIALSLLLEPQVLVMDEPTASLDLLMQRSILHLLTELKRKFDLTIVFITHDLPLVTKIADRLAVMYAFGFVEQGPVAEMVDDAAHPYTRALLSATPNLDMAIEEMQPIEGSSPDPVNSIPGCPYNPRCPLADETCRTTDPSFERVSTGHETRCFHWEQADEAVPLGTKRTRDGAKTTEPTSTASVDRAGAEPVLSLRDVAVEFSTGGSLSKLWSKPDPVRAVDGVSLDVYENEVVALVGESGCGKTTLGKTAIGLQAPTSGTIEYRGESVVRPADGFLGGSTGTVDRDVRRALQIIHQDPGSSLNPNKRVSNILSRPLKQWYGELDRRERMAWILSLLKRVGMDPPEDYAGRYPHQLSGGEKQRVALIRALMLEPDVVLADEAISALDVSLRIEMMDLMIELQDLTNTSYLFISHDLSNARYIAEKSGGRIGVMYLGELVEIGPVDQILYDPQHPYTKALIWATPNLFEDEGAEETIPIRGIDIPSPANPPSGCKFHTRCPVAREACAREEPPAYPTSDGDDHRVACFRADETHEYWESDDIVE